MLTWRQAYDFALEVSERESIRMRVRAERTITGAWVYWPEIVR